MLRNGAGRRHGCGLRGLVVVVTVHYLVDGFVQQAAELPLVVVVGNEHYGVEDPYKLTDVHVLPLRQRRRVEEPMRAVFMTSYCDTCILRNVSLSLLPTIINSFIFLLNLNVYNYKYRNMRLLRNSTELYRESPHFTGKQGQ